MLPASPVTLLPDTPATFVHRCCQKKDQAFNTVHGPYIFVSSARLRIYSSAMTTMLFPSFAPVWISKSACPIDSKPP